MLRCGGKLGDLPQRLKGSAPVASNPQCFDSKLAAQPGMIGPKLVDTLGQAR